MRIAYIGCRFAAYDRLVSPLAYAQLLSLTSPTKLSFNTQASLVCPLSISRCPAYIRAHSIRILPWKQYAACIVDMVKDHGALLASDVLQLFEYYAFSMRLSQILLRGSHVVSIRMTLSGPSSDS
jgi:hypothetical protein